LRERARRWPPMASTRPLDTGGWTRPGFLIAYADRSDRDHPAVQTSYRVDFDGVRALAARVASEHVDQGSFFGGEQPEGDHPVELASGSPAECADAAAAWFHRQLTAWPGLLLTPVAVTYVGVSSGGIRTISRWASALSHVITGAAQPLETTPRGQAPSRGGALDRGARQPGLRGLPGARADEGRPALRPPTGSLPAAGPPAGTHQRQRPGLTRRQGACAGFCRATTPKR
jgi:hypothetical protein